MHTALHLSYPASLRRHYPDQVMRVRIRPHAKSSDMLPDSVSAKAPLAIYSFLVPVHYTSYRTVCQLFISLLHRNQLRIFMLGTISMPSGSCRFTAVRVPATVPFFRFPIPLDCDPVSWLHTACRRLPLKRIHICPLFPDKP